ncbi:MAG: 50S ribosomal protein L17 [Halanaerobium sp.]|nr:50S ribosomal protein L17 [Halanaerobium sp.]
MPRKLSRRTGNRLALINNLVRSLMINGKIETTYPKAKEASRVADRMISLAKKGDLHSRRQALKILKDKDVVAELFERIGPRFAERNGGYTRVLKICNRRGDGAMTAILELVD